ncbi:hypothetical protein ACKC9G_08090 [Pokkaliibacter sp. CJK22405]|uniref:hypothetical protein n=1 Tax=Pokkaliibacter sp. CJK22405 TaxID=3384615 RepID=UPI0039855D1B
MSAWKAIILGLCLFGAYQGYQSHQHKKITPVAFVQRSELSTFFSTIANKQLKHSQSYHAFIAQYGPAGNALIESEMRAAIARYQSDWNQKMAVALTQYITPAELQSIYNEREDSSYRHKLKGFAQEIAVASYPDCKLLIDKAINETLLNARQKV